MKVMKMLTNKREETRHKLTNSLLAIGYGTLVLLFMSHQIPIMPVFENLENRENKQKTRQEPAGIAILSPLSAEKKCFF